MPRVWDDVDRLIDFVARQLRGQPAARRADIFGAFDEIVAGPELNDIGARRRENGLQLRRYNVRQFAVIYAYLGPNTEYPDGLVSIRAVRHSRVKNVFKGVRERLRIWNAAEHLESADDMLAYLEAALEYGDPALVATALADIARASAAMPRQRGVGG